MAHLRDRSRARRCFRGRRLFIGRGKQWRSGTGHGSLDTVVLVDCTATAIESRDCRGDSQPERGRESAQQQSTRRRRLPLVALVRPAAYRWWVRTRDHGMSGVCAVAQVRSHVFRHLNRVVEPLANPEVQMWLGGRPRSATGTVVHDRIVDTASVEVGA
jgi:hypothetical protein